MLVRHWPPRCALRARSRAGGIREFHAKPVPRPIQPGRFPVREGRDVFELELLFSRDVSMGGLYLKHDGFYWVLVYIWVDFSRFVACRYVEIVNLLLVRALLLSFSSSLVSCASTL